MNRSEDPELDPWLRGLRGEPSTGEPSTGEHPAAEREAAQLRRALQAQAAGDKAADQQQLPSPEEFVRRLEARSAAPAKVRARRPRRALWALAAAAAAVAGAVLLLRPLLPQAVPVESYRGAASTPQLRVSQPGAVAQSLQSQLQALGYTVTLRALPPQAWRLEIAPGSALLPAQQEEAAKLLAQYELTLPADGWLLLEIQPR